MARPSSIRVFVNFKDDGIVFAGEDIQCTITFKNVESRRSRIEKHAQASHTSIEEKTVAIFDQLKVARARAASQPSKTLLNSPRLEDDPTEILGKVKRPTVRTNGSEEKRQTEESSGGFHIVDSTERKHSRSVSIKSLGSPLQQRPSVRHERSSSVHTTPPRSIARHRPSLVGRPSSGHGPASPPMIPGAPTPTGSPRPLAEGTRTGSPNQQAPSPRTPRSEMTSPMPSPSLSRSSSRTVAVSILPFDNVTVAGQRLSNVTTTVQPPSPSPLGSRLAESNMVITHGQSVYPSVADTTPRGSTELYSHSNRSDETLVSELPAQDSRLLRRPQFTRLASQLGPGVPPEARIETLMMGYAQVAGSFIMDESLVNLQPFEDLKRRAVVGGQAGGGVVGIASSTSDAGMFGGLGWGSIGESLGGLLGGGGGPSSMKEMKGIADTKSIPLLSTPKSILFVDLRLAIGESKSYDYTFRMPRGLPPTHRGRAIKVSYNLIIVTQRPGLSKGAPQQIKQVEIPFRVFSGVNSLGENLEHDLMSPYIILQDKAHVIQRDSTLPPSQSAYSVSTKLNSSSIDFQTYVNHLLSQRKDSTYMGILSPTVEGNPSPLQRSISHPQRGLPSPKPNSNYTFSTANDLTTRALIDAAIRQTSIVNSPVYSPSKFTIARSSVPIATLMLSRSAIKLGDLLTCVLDFSTINDQPPIPTVAIEATLESTERIDPALAIRSPQSVERATRRVWGRIAEPCVFALRSNFSFQIPVFATPGFGTTGVGLDWNVRLEFVTTRESAGMKSARASAETIRASAGSSGGGSARHSTDSRTGGAAVLAETEGSGDAGPLLEVVSTDQRGTVYAARRWVSCESFEVVIPIRVFGAAVGRAGGEDLAMTEGFPI